LILQTNPQNCGSGIFTFVTPDGAQYHGGQAGDIRPDGQSGQLKVHYTGAVKLLTTATAPATTVQVNLEATIDPATRQATAELEDHTT
jgi:hypothetical protein